MSLTSEQIRVKAFELGFAAAGFSRIQPVNLPERLDSWLEAGQAGTMHWMERNREKRLDPGKINPEMKSLVSLALNYFTPGPASTPPDGGIISRYARGMDYHDIFQSKIRQLSDWMISQAPNLLLQGYCDSGPIMEKTWSQQGGIGWIGKHSNLVIRQLGSWVFLGEILLNQELQYDAEASNRCGRCERCLQSCPTRAIVAPYVVDARRCISYLTIENRGPIPRPLRPQLGRFIFGCDVCQEACPWNRFSQAARETGFHPRPEWTAPSLIELMGISEEGFLQKFRQSPVRRARYAGFLRNVAVALGNSGIPEAVPPLLRQSGHPDPLVRGHVAWALGRLKIRQSEDHLLKWKEAEKDPGVLEEIDSALKELGLRQERAIQS